MHGRVRSNQREHEREAMQVSLMHVAAGVRGERQVLSRTHSHQRERKMKLSDKLDRIRKASPNRSAFGQLYKTEGETRKRFKRVTLYTLFLSDEATHLMRNHVFDSNESRTAEQWSDWFGENLRRIHESGVLPGLALRT